MKSTSKDMIPTTPPHIIGRKLKDWGHQGRWQRPSGHPQMKHIFLSRGASYRKYLNVNFLSIMGGFIPKVTVTSFYSSPFS